MSDKFFYLQFKFIPKIGHTFTDEREVVVEVPKDLVQRKSESINEGLREVVALDLKGIRYYRRNHRENGARDRRSRPKSRVNPKLVALSETTA